MTRIPDWRFDGSCRDHPEVDWFPQESRRRRPAADSYATPKAICLTMCPIVLDCAEAGLHEPYGIWGGLEPKDRKKLRSVLRRGGQDFPDAFEQVAKRGIFA